MPISPTEVEHHERLSRFIYDERAIDRKRGVARQQAFRLDGDEVSVFRTSELTEAETWRLEAEHIAPSYNRPVVACAHFGPDAVPANRLRVIPAEPPPRHACIRGWPLGQNEIDQAERLYLRQQIAASTRLTYP